MKKSLLVGLLVVGTFAGFAVLVAAGTVASLVNTIFTRRRTGLWHNAPSLCPVDLEVDSFDPKAWEAMHVL